MIYNLAFACDTGYFELKKDPLPSFKLRLTKSKLNEQIKNHSSGLYKANGRLEHSLTVNLLEKEIPIPKLIFEWQETKLGAQLSDLREKMEGMTDYEEIDVDFIITKSDFKYHIANHPSWQNSNTI